MAHTWKLQVVLLSLVAGSWAQFQTSAFQQHFGEQGSFQPQEREQPPQAPRLRVPELPSVARRKQQQQQHQHQRFQPQPQPQPQQFQPVQPAPVPFQPPPPPPQPQPQPQPQQFFDQGQDYQQDYEEPAPAAPPAPPVRAPARTAPPPNPLRKAASPIASAKRPNFDEELIKQQNENAKYSFSAAVTDGIMDNQQVREEVRDGLKLRGMYSYSDGYYKRTVHYEADEGGYRVVNEEAEPIGNGPLEDPTGRAEVASNVGGNDLYYKISGSDILRRPAPAAQPDVRGPLAGSVRRPPRPGQQNQPQQLQSQQYQEDYQQQF